MPANDSPGTFFEALPREATLVQRVIEQLEARIHAGQLRPGDRIPPERDLAAQLGVSRTVVREAVAALSAKSLLEAATRGGAIVRIPTAENVTQTMRLYLRGVEEALNYAQIHEVRHVLEVEIAGLAALRRSEEDLIAMDALLREMEAIGPELPNYFDRYVEDDVQFHRLLAQATGNPLFPVLLDSVADIMREVRRLGAQVQGSVENALTHHRTIYEAVCRGEEAQARQAMIAHLADSEAIQKRV